MLVPKLIGVLVHHVLEEVASVSVAVVEVHLPGPAVQALLVLLSGCAPWNSLKNSLNSASCSLLELISRLITCRSVNPKLEATVS